MTLILTETITGTDFEHRYNYSVRDSNGHAEKVNGAEWADWDQQGRLVFAQGGKIFALNANAMGQEPPQELIDLNGNKFKPMEAPEWAKVW